MPAPYDYDLRRKAVDAVHRGERKSTVSRLFEISRNTLDLWLKRESETGDCHAITDYQNGHSHQITDWDKFRAFAQEHGDNTQAQMAELWGHGISQQTISVALRKIGFTRKKRRMAIENEMKPNAKNS